MSVDLRYLVFGLHVRSEIELPELWTADPASPPDLVISRGNAPDAGPAAEPQKVDGGVLLTIQGVARFLIRHGSEIIVDADPDASEPDVRLFLLGSAMGLVLHQRGLLPLHANAVKIGDKAIAFMGRSGAGKSTLAAWFSDRGYQFLADDVCVVRFDPAGRAVAVPGLPRLRLWREALEASGRDPAAYQPSFAGAQFQKYDVPIAVQRVALGSTELAGIYLLEVGSPTNITRLRGVEAVAAIMANTYRGGYLPLVGGEQVHWSAAMRLVNQVPVFRAERQWSLEEIDGQSEQLLRHATTSLEFGCA